MRDTGPNSRLSGLVRPTRSERHRLLVEWNSTAAELPPATVPELVARQASRTPEELALVYGDGGLTYRELDREVARLAGRLRAAGVGAGGTVAVSLPRSPRLVVTLLAVLRAGAAYVPVDPALPSERRRFMIEDSGACLCIDSGSPEPGRTESGPPLAEPAPEDLAYVIYTSGSTGRPKGVAVPHRALGNLVLAMRDLLRLRRGDRLLAVTTPSFDISALELYVPLVSGATVALLPEGLAVDGKAVVGELERHRVTALQATPAFWRILVEAGWQGRLEVAVCGGEALDPALADELARRGGRVWNVYGPTETTIWSTCARVEAGALVSIGRPIANTRVYVLDDGLEPVPVGVAGELYVGGAGVARGYVGRSALTAERFVPDPFGPAGARLYRTGDVVRFRPDGELEFLGRQDDQVKVRGHRVEPGEVESVLKAQPGVRAAAVTAQADAKDGVRLVAYVAAGEAEAAALPTLLRRFLPEAMIPSAWVRLDALPLTASGKIDRRALPAPARGVTSARGRDGGAALRTPTERLVGEIWRSVLGLPRVGRDDNFFEVGGHSLALVTVQARLLEATGRELSVPDLFRYPTVRGLAAHLDGDDRSRGLESAARRVAARRRRPRRRAPSSAGKAAIRQGGTSR